MKWNRQSSLNPGYGTLFLWHIFEDITDAATFSDGVPKEGLRIEDVLISYGTLLRVVLKHGYGRWQDIVDDKYLRVQEVICQELNLPLTAPGGFDQKVQNFYYHYYLTRHL